MDDARRRVEGHGRLRHRIDHQPPELAVHAGLGGSALRGVGEGVVTGPERSHCQGCGEAEQRDLRGQSAGDH
jgi:hypothetical protein